METVVAPTAEIAKPKQAKEAAPIPAKGVEKPGPILSKITITAVQQASGNLAIQRSVEAGEAEPTTAIEKAPARPHEDGAYQAVIKQLRVKSKHERTPPKEAVEKKEEVKQAAELPREKREEKTGFDHHLEAMQAVPTPRIEDFTVAGFVELFRAKVDQIAGQLPKEKGEKGSVAKAAFFAVEKTKAIQDVKTQNQNLSAPLQKEVAKNPAELREKISADAPELKVDPAGDTPNITNAKAAAVKPRSKDEVSMDEESRALDDSLKNHNVGGQQVNIDEGSLAYPISGEKDFDEAGESKRKAQEEIRKVFPRYRAQEKPVIAKAETEVPDIVESGLVQQHQVRSKKFGEVLVTQKSHESTIESEKDRVFAEFQKIYKKAKEGVDTELKTISDIETDFEKVLTDAENFFKSWVRQDLEYIYTPGFFDYSDWKDVNAKEIRDEHEKLRQEGGDEEPDYIYGLKAMQIVRDRHAKALFEKVKNHFIWQVMQGVEQIGHKVVQALNNANNHIRTAQVNTKKEYDKLDPKEQTEMETAYTTIMGQYENLTQSVKDREVEIVADMARNYSKGVGKLQATFDSIKKDVLTSWLEKAWNKIKAVVNAIIEFAKRIAELLVRMLHLVGDIIASPLAFFRNLASGISQGFSTFVERIDEFLATAFFDWIRGASGVRVQLPKEWNAAGIFSLFTQLLNLSTETIWQRMEVVYDKTVADAFRRGEAVVEKGLEIFEIVKNEGLGGLWDHIVESLGTLLSDTLDQMKETVLYAAIKKVLIEIGKMLVPGGGFIAIAEKVIRLLVFIVEARNKILDLIESFVSSMENAVRGDVAGIVTKVTGALTKFITIALDFLVTFFGLSGLKEKVERLIQRMRNPIIKGIDFVLRKFKPLVMKGKELAVKAKEKAVATGKQIVQVVRRWLGLEKKFVGDDGIEHRLYFAGSETSQVLMVSSNPVPYGTFMESVEVGTDDKKVKAKAVALPIARKIDEKRLERLEGTTEDEKEKSRQEKLLAVEELLEHLAPPTRILFGDPSAAGEPDVDNTTQGAGYGLTMTSVRLNKKQKLKGSPPTSAMNNSYQILNNRRQEENPKTSYYVKGHLLNENVGGVGNWNNLTPLSRKGNSDHESEVESLVKAAFESSAVVEYNVTAVYGYGQNEGQIPEGDPNAAEKKRIISEEVNVPTTLACEAFVMEKVDNKFVRKQSIVKADVANPIGQNAASYVLSSSPARETIYLNDASADQIATIEGVDATLAANIVLAHEKNYELNGSPRFNSWVELSDARKNRAHHRIFCTEDEQERIKGLAAVKYVRLYRGAGGATVPAAQADISGV